jgi:tripartite-type tricarboxylate transporter receptor subunit TctC
VLFTVDIPLTMYPAVAKGLPYDPRADFRAIANVAQTVNALFVNAAVNASTPQELAALARAQPGRLTFSSAGIASPGHFGGELFKSIGGVDMTHVPYKGAAPAMNAALSGEVSLFFGPITQGLPHVKSGKLKVLGVTGPQASPLLPGVKPLIEQGFPGLLVYNWYPVMVPARTPDAVVAVLSSELKRVFDDPALRARLDGMGTTPLWEGPQEVMRAIDADIKRWSEVARRARIEAPQ